ncbi:NUDIX hydrolase domain-like protein [Sporodiniella umbellata]|nr:NUDIX hydrolase domain-like protein [Sporodiniella umbellata]
MQYRFRIPVCGAIIINPNLDKCVLVKGWSSKSGWGFPKGKINQEEEYDSCAIREVLEETGYDIGPLLKKTDYVELTMREQRIRLYIIQGVPETTEFIPRTRKEISQISWIRLEDLPTYKTLEPRHTGGSLNYVKAGPYRFYMVVPFVNQLKKIINQRKKSLRKTGEKASKPQSPRKIVHQAEVNIPSSPLSYQSATPSNALKSMLGVRSENQKGVFATASPANSQHYPTHQPPSISGNNLLQQLFSSSSNGPQQYVEQPFSPSPNVPQYQHQEKTTLQQQSMLSSSKAESPSSTAPVHSSHLKPSTSENTVRRNSLLDLLQGNSRNEHTKVIDPVQAFMQGNIQIQSHEHLYSPTFNNSLE